MDLFRIARKVSEKKIKSRKPVPEPEIEEIPENILDPGVEYSFKIDLSLTVDFEGDAIDISESRLRRKLKAEILAAMKGAALITANDFGLRASNIKISPVSVGSAMNDQTSIGDKTSGNV